MDRKSLLVLVASFGLLLLWPILVGKLYPPVPAPAGSRGAPGITNLHGSTNVPTLSTPEATPPAPAPATPTSSAPLISSNAPEELLALENKDARYVFTSHGGGLKAIELKAYPESVDCSRGAAKSPRRVATLNAGASVPVLTLLGGEALQGDGLFRLTELEKGIRAEKSLAQGLSLAKEFRLGSNYLISARVSLANTSAVPVTLPAQEWIVGTTTPMGPIEAAMEMGAYWFDGRKVEHIGASWFDNRTLGCIPGTPRTHYSAGGPTNVAWAAAHNQFFSIAVIPRERASLIGAVQTNLPPPSADELRDNPKADPKPKGYRVSLGYPAATLAPGQTVTHEFQIYAGPKEYNTLARHAGQMNNQLDSLMGFDTVFGGSVFGFFAKILLLGMNGLHRLGLAYGLAIIVITVIIKLVFWPLTTASTRSMKRMAALQPQMKALQDKYKEDPAKMQRKLMEFMKEHKVSPLGGCLPMMLQIPVFFGFFTMMRTAIELRGAKFLWACDLSRPDTIFTIPGLGFLPFIGIPSVGLPINPMPICMGITMLWQARLTPPSPGMDPMQQKMMKYMPMMVLLFLYNYSAGLTLYWTVQNLLTIAQMKLTKTNEPAAPTPPPARPPTPAAAKKK